MREIAGYSTDDYNFMTMDGYDDCIVGVVERIGMHPIVCYDRDAVIKKLMDDGAEWEEAEEYFQFNQLGAWHGEATPCFITHGQPT